MTVAVFAAHPDDETLGCGATLALLAKHGDVHVTILGEGITAREAQRDDHGAIEELYTDAHTAASVLGVSSVRLEGLPDLRFDSLPLLDIVWRVERVIREIRPTVVYTHHAGDLNRDHQLTLRAVLTATRPLAGCPVLDIYSFQVPSSTEWAFGTTGPAFRPNVFVDVTSTIEQKVQAMECYRSERRDFPHPRSADALRALARHWGSVVGRPYAEAFSLVRSVRSVVDGPPDDPGHVQPPVPDS
jgi:LmbE family N-acetylglucosaminyl deacetylase